MMLGLWNKFLRFVWIGNFGGTGRESENIGLWNDNVDVCIVKEKYKMRSYVLKNWSNILEMDTALIQEQSEKI